MWIFKNIFPNMFLIKSLLLFQLLFMMFNKNPKSMHVYIHTYRERLFLQ